MSKHIMYHKTDNGWLAQVFPEQCKKDVFILGECQGEKGHDGDCWCYRENGSYQYSINGDLKDSDIAGGSTPPDHESWIHPAEKEYYMRNYTTYEVTDQTVIDRLNRGELLDNESLTEPVDFDEEMDIS